jgi:tetratricopeptide (TPR) repeat protein
MTNWQRLIRSGAAIILATLEHLAVWLSSKVRELPKLGFISLVFPCFVLLFFGTLVGGRPLISAQAQSSSHHQQPSPLDLEIQTRLADLSKAKQSGDPAVVIETSRKVAAVALRRTGQILVMRASYSEAENVYKRSLDFEDAAATHLDLCMAYLSAKQAGDCLSETGKVILKDPQNAAAWRVQSEAWKMKGDSSHADASLKQAEELPANPGDMPAPLLAVTTLSPVQRARITFQQSELAKILANTLNDLGAAEARESKFQLALSHFHEAERWQPALPGLMRNLGLAADRVSDYPEAVRALRGVVAANPHDQLARTVLGSALFSTNAFAEAAQVFAPLGDSALQEPGVAYAWAVSLIKLNRFQQAGALLDKLEQQPLPAEIFVLVAQARSQMGDYPHAVTACRRALTVDPTTPKAHYISAVAMLREGHSSEAETELRAELQLDPNSIDAQYNLAFVLLQQSRPEEAVVWLEKVVAENPSHAEANYELGKQLLADGRTAEAAKYLEVAARLSPRLAHIHYQLQAAYRTLGRQQDADRELQIYREIKEKSRTPISSTPKP